MNDAIAVVGAGIAGLSLVDALLERGMRPSELIVIDAGDPHRGSNAPATVLHPFAGRTMAPGEEHWRAFLKSWETLKRWCAREDEPLWRPAPMMRLMEGDKLSAKLEESWEEGRARYPEVVKSRRVEGDESVRLLPSWQGAPALVYEPAAAVDLPGLCAALLKRAKERGVRVVQGEVADLRGGEEGWVIGFAGGAPALRVARVVLATGAALGALLGEADLRERPGEVGVWEATGPLEDLNVMINSAANLFERPDGRVGVGSTYLKREGWREREDAEADRELREKMAAALGGADPGTALEIWRGVRGIYGSDHRPLVGPVAGERELFVMAGFGSKGLTWAPAMGQVLAAHLLEGAAIWDVVDARRARRMRLRA
ncbi:NAD(P)/FAD-dependent oxidoreductase [Lujinxingia vulgaris]|uniref:NAD(P)/FAD-dependent oxidoreductase n=1 Tax=Lujinxingia vulgaris TaxID=2600176 RepID=UPI001E315C27|nr:FAD-dependent oxidoreductase [Lujinxingia vulgaris]